MANRRRLLYDQAMAARKDYYKILGVSRTATTEEIRDAYRALARKHHPDVSKAKDAQGRFSEISEAYDVLGDPEKRASYDRYGHAAGPAAAGAQPHGQTRWTSTGNVGFDAADFGSVFEEMFRGAGPRMHPQAAAQEQRRAAPPAERRTVDVSFVTAARGGSEPIRDGGKTIDVKIPAGIDTGAKLRVKKADRGGAASDLILTVNVGRHPHFRRDGLDLLIDVPITIAEAALGTMVSVPMLDARVDLKIPPGTSSGAKLRVKGKGIESANATGDFYAVVQIVAPKTLSDASRTKLETLQADLQNPRDSAPWTD